MENPNSNQVNRSNRIPGLDLTEFATNNGTRLTIIDDSATGAGGNFTANNIRRNVGGDFVSEVATSVRPEISLRPGQFLERLQQVRPVRQADLVARFDGIELPDTVDFGDDGIARITITNRGNAIARGPIDINLYISTDNNIDRNAAGELVNDGLLTTIFRNINLRPGQSTTIEIPYENLTSVIAHGSYNLIAEVDSDNAIAERNENNNVVSQLVSAPGTDVIIDWTSIALNAIQAEGEAGRGVPPTVGSRLLAMLGAAVYDTVNAFEQTHESFAVDATAPFNASVQAAAAAAAHRILVELLPEQRSFLDQQLVRSLIEIPDNPVTEATGLQFGRLIADQILDLRANDGADDDTPYTPGDGDYVWIPGADGIALGPNWGNVTPFAIPDVESFAPDGLDGVPGTDQYVQELEEVRLFGGRESTDLSPVLRTADQTEIAVFWAYDRADTFRPYGQLYQIAQEAAIREGNTLGENARLFLQLGVALADSAVVAWDAKYDFTQPRPDVRINGNDGDPLTVGDPDWQPLLPTPPFPDYISGHSTFGGAFAGVLTNFFGENYEFTAVSQELLGVTRTYGSFYEAAFDDAISRIYGGVHTREASVTDALPTGINIGNYVANNVAQAIA